MAARDIRVAPDDLEGAASTLGSVRGELGSDAVSGTGTGTGALDGALSALSGRLDFVARALDDALEATGRNLAAGAESYRGTDATQFRGGGR